MYPICTAHDTGNVRKTYCLECQKAGTGGGGLCSGFHGREKRHCKECHPKVYDKELERRHKRAAAKKDLKKTDESSGPKIKANDNSKCVCGKRIQDNQDPLCPGCATDLKNILE